MRFGATILVRTACSLAAIGLVLALMFAWTPAVLFGLVGFGLSVPFPLVLSAAGRLAKRGEGFHHCGGHDVGVFGMIAGPPMIGFIADQVGMRLALATVMLLCVLAALCAPAVSTAVVKEDVPENT